MRLALVAAAAAAALLTATSVQAQVRVFVGGAVTVPVREAGAEFTKRTGKTLDIQSDTTGALQRRLRAGEKADVVVITAPAIEALTGEKLLAATGRTDLARGLVGVAVKSGEPAPDLSSMDALKATLLKARTVSYVSPAAGGTSGAHIEGLIAKMGIAEQIKPKVVYRNQGSEVAQAVASGAAEIGFTFTSEISPVPGVRVAGVLPAEAQLPTIYTAALSASPPNPAGAAALMDVLKGPTGRAALQKAGLETLVK